jgi:hypothetical protein
MIVFDSKPTLKHSLYLNIRRPAHNDFVYSGIYAVEFRSLPHRDRA